MEDELCEGIFILWQWSIWDRGNHEGDVDSLGGRDGCGVNGEDFQDCAKNIE